MIKLDITGRNFTADDKIRDYIRDKIGGLDKYLPRRDRSNATGIIVLEEDPSGREDNRFVCEAILMVQGTQLMSKEGTVNMYAAVDIVEAKLKSQVRTYKDKHTRQPRRMRMISRLIGRKSETDPATAAVIETVTEAD